MKRLVKQRAHRHHKDPDLRSIVLDLKRRVQELQLSGIEYLQPVGGVSWDVATRQEVNALVRSQHNLAQSVIKMQGIMTRVLENTVKASRRTR